MVQSDYVFYFQIHALFDLSVIQSGKEGIRGLVSRELGSVIRALFEEAEVIVFLGIVTNGGQGSVKRNAKDQNTTHKKMQPTQYEE